MHQYTEMESGNSCPAASMHRSYYGTRPCQANCGWWCHGSTKVLPPQLCLGNFGMVWAPRSGTSTTHILGRKYARALRIHFWGALTKLLISRLYHYYWVLQAIALMNKPWITSRMGDWLIGRYIHGIWSGTVRPFLDCVEFLVMLIVVVFQRIYQEAYSNIY